LISKRKSFFKKKKHILKINFGAKVKPVSAKITFLKKIKNAPRTATWRIGRKVRRKNVVFWSRAIRVR
jgi:hypothetical protein